MDIGNTAVGIARFQDGTPDSRFQFPTPSPDSTEPWRPLAGRGFLDGITAVVVSSVVPRLDAGLVEFLEKTRKLTPRFVAYGIPLEIELDVDNPREVGADRIADVVGALDFVTPPCLVIDSGTALTVDVLDARSRYRGGVIIPGIQISIRSLARHAARLEEVEFVIPESPLGRNTADCIRAGVFYSHLGGMQLLIREYRKLLGPRTRVVATGGAVASFQGALSSIHRYEPDLIHYGLKRIHAYWQRWDSR